MSGIVHKVKDMIHGDKDKDTTHTDSTHSSHTTGHGTMNPADRNNDGRVDAHDLTGQHGATGGLAGHNTTGGVAGHGTANPLDRNNDGRVDAHDVAGRGATGGIAGHNTIDHGSTGGMTGHGTANPLDRNNDGRVDARDVTGQGHSTAGGIGHSSTGHGSGLAGSLNTPLDRAPLTGSGTHNTRTADILDPHGNPTHATTGSGLGHSSAGGVGHTANPLDRNNDGRVNAHDLTGQGHSTTGGMGHSSVGGVSHSSVSGVGHSSVGGVGQPGTGVAGHTANPLDRNNDGRVDARDIAGQGHSSVGGVGHSSAGVGHTANPLDRNNDGRVDAHDVTGSHSSSGLHGNKPAGGLDHRAGESGDLPRALTEDKSRAQPHGFTENQHHSSGMTTGAKPSMKDKLNPKIDADGDGKAGIMD